MGRQERASSELVSEPQQGPRLPAHLPAKLCKHSCSLAELAAGGGDKGPSSQAWKRPSALCSVWVSLPVAATPLAVRQSLRAGGLCADQRGARLRFPVQSPVLILLLLS